MPRYLLRVAYDGTDYVGWQRQASGVSIQQRLEEAATALSREPVTVVGAGRTDAGVHAIGQAAHFDLADPRPPDVVVKAMNARLPDDIRVREVRAVDDRTHARYSATGKTYRYRWLVSATGQPLLERYAWRVAPPIDVDAMTAAARRLVGRHDFAGFQSTGTDVSDTVRELTDAAVRVLPVEAPESLGLSGDEALVELLISGTGFLRHMVRAIAGTLTDIGRGRWPVSRIDEILAVRDRSLAGPTAPAHGLTLVDVRYPQATATTSPAAISPAAISPAATPASRRGRLGDASAPGPAGTSGN